MTPGTYHLNLYRGDTYAWTFRLWADPERTVPVVLTGAVAAAEVREKSAGTTIVPLVVAIEPPGGNTIEVQLNTTEWELGVPVSGVWDLQVTHASGAVQTVVAGKVTVTGDVTDSTVAAAAALAARRGAAA